MADNLTVSIGIDTKKLAADIELAKAQLKGLGKAVKDASAEATKTGDRSRVDQLSAAYDTLNRSLIQHQRVQRENNRMLAGSGAAAAGAARGLHALSGAHAEAAEKSELNTREIIKVSKELGTLEINGFGVAKMFKELPKVAVPIAIAAGVAAAAGKMGELALEAAKSVRAVEDLHDATGRPTRDILALRQTFIGVNGEAKDADAWIRRMSEDFTKAHENAAGLESALSGITTGRGGQPGVTGGMQVMRGSAIDRAGVLPAAPSSGFAPGGMLVTRGGQPMKLDVEHGLGGLVDQGQFPLTAKGQNQFQEQALKILTNIDKTNHMLALRVAGTEMPGAQPEVALRELLGQAVAQAMEHAGEVGLRPAPEDLRPGAGQMATGLQIAQKQAGVAGEDLQTQAGLGLMTGTTNALQGITSGLEATTEHMQTTGEVWDRITKDMTANWDELKLDAQLGIDPALSTNTFEGAWTGAITGIENAWKAAVDYMNTTTPAAPGGQTGQTIPIAPAGGMATGGIVPGRGSGDTVPAWLTPGEYVNRRASVGYYGAGLFAALNDRAIPRGAFSRFGYASGGLVGDIGSFAEGGAVRGGTPVHLHIGSGTFPLSGSESVVGALVAESTRQQMRSAGVKPSWYGGRPGA